MKKRAWKVWSDLKIACSLEKNRKTSRRKLSSALNVFDDNLEFPIETDVHGYGFVRYFSSKRHARNARKNLAIKTFTFRGT